MRPQCRQCLVVPAERAGDHGSFAGADAQGRGGQSGQGSGRRCQFDQGRGTDHRLAEAQEENGQFLPEVAGQGDEDRGLARGVDRGPGQAQDQFGREAIAQLGIDRVGAEDALGQLGPGVRRLIGEPCPTHHGDAAGPARVLCRLQPRGSGGEGLAPTDGDKLPVLADLGLDEATVFEATRLARLAEELPARGAQADHLAGSGRRHVDRLVGQGRIGRRVVDLIAIDRFEGEPSLVTEPAVVHRVRVDAQQPCQPVGGGLHRHPAPHGAGGAGRFHLVQVPRTGREAVGRRGERADRADLHRVAAEVGRERLGRESGDFHALAPPGEVDLGFTRHIGREPGAAGALDTALTIEQHQVRNGDRLLEVALFLDEPALPGPVRQRLVLQWALAALVADRAVERVIRQEELEDTVLCLLDLFGVGADRHPLGHRDEAGRLQGGPARAVHLDQAHAAHADGLHTWVVAEAWDVGPGPLGGGNQQFTGLGGHGAPVEVEAQVISQRGTPPLSRARGTRRGTCGWPRRSKRVWRGRARRWSSAGAARPRRARCCHTGP